MPNLLEVFLVFLRLGCTSFGGPVAHLGYFHHEFVERRRWIDDRSYADLVALCQFLPGPASSQVGIAIGLSRAGYLGAIAAWLGFTLPSAVLLVGFALGVANFQSLMGNGWLHGLKLAAVAVVAQAVWAMAKKFCPDPRRILLAVGAAAVCAMSPSALSQVAVLIFTGALGALFLRPTQELPHVPIKSRVSRRMGGVFLLVFGLLLFLLPFVVRNTEVHGLKLFESFFRAGSLVFGGGHVVLPLLQAAVVPSGWVSNDVFMAGYGAAQAIPGPLFTFSAYLGAVSRIEPSGWLGAGLCLIAAFLPSFLLILGVIPFWERLRGIRAVRSAMIGVNAGVVGLLMAALYSPVWTSAVFEAKDFALALAAFLLLAYFKLQSWVVVLASALVYAIIAA